MTTTLVEVLTTSDGGRMEVTRDGEISHPRVKTPWTVVRHHYFTADGTYKHSDTYLEGARGGFYYLRPYLGQDTGRRQMVSMKSGGNYRIKGNPVEVIEVAGIIEFLK